MKMTSLGLCIYRGCDIWNNQTYSRSIRSWHTTRGGFIQSAPTCGESPILRNANSIWPKGTALMFRLATRS